MSNAASTPEFKKILKDVYDSGKYRTSGEVLKESWRIWHDRHGVDLQKSPEQKRRYAERKSFENPSNFTRIQLQKYFESIPGTLRQRLNEVEKAFGIYDVKVTGQRGKKLQIVSWKLIEHRKNPTAILEDRRGRTYRYPVKRGQYRTPLELERAASRYHGQDLSFIKSNAKRRKKNPIAVYNPRSGVKLPATNIEVRYRRTTGEYKGENFRHHYKSSVSLIGLPNGDVLIHSNSGKKLWGKV